MSLTSSLWWLHSTNVCSSNISDITHGKRQPWYHGHFSLKQTPMKLNKMQTEYVILQKKKHPNTPTPLPPPLKNGFYLKYHHEIAHIHHKISVLLDSKWLYKSFWMYLYWTVMTLFLKMPGHVWQKLIIFSPKCKVISLNLLYNYFEMLNKHLSTIPTGIQPLFSNRWPLQK